MRLKAVVEFDGTDFFGWQVQPDKVTIQGEIENALEQITGEKIRITGAGRTDAGVHALGYVASFVYDGGLTPDRLRIALNSVLPRSIFIKSIEEVPDSFDAKRDAASKLYRYRIIRGRSPLHRGTAWEYSYDLDIERMKLAAALLVGEHDYAALCEVEDPRPSITVDSVDIREEGDEIVIEVRGKSFLYKMVRRMVGVVTECGRGKIEPQIIPELFNRTKPVQTITAPANGLVLVEVLYPKED
ncbi:MAG: tRNA pseudouridine(38-40) synthase TruA [candidate division WOR-3 bacterium]|nr:tRNA pseudouridine(38-40) synthase TruA [candidate division WOR-3 bacterium]